MKAWFALLGRLLWPSFVIKVVWGLLLLLLTAALWLSVAILRLSVKAQLQQLDWGQLKLANLQTIRSGL